MGEKESLYSSSYINFGFGLKIFFFIARFSNENWMVVNVN